MKDPQSPVSTAEVAAALRAQEPGGPALLFDSYGDRLFRFCWFMLRNRIAAQTALRDSLVVAQAHASRLADPARLNSWLYAITRAECHRHLPAPPAEADEPPARPSQADADSRLMAWQAVTGIAPQEMEALELACRHDVELDLVLGITGRDATALLDRARLSLERELGAGILINRGGHACPDRAQVLRGWSGTVTPEVRERVLLHAGTCQVCLPSLPRNVSAARVFALLPVPVMPLGARQQLLDFFADDRMASYREFAIARVAGLTPEGFPQAAAPALVCASPPAAPAPALAPAGPVRGGVLAPAGPVRGEVLAAAGWPAAPAGWPAAPADWPAAPAGWPAVPRPAGGRRNRRPVVVAAIAAAGVLAVAVVAALVMASTGAGPRGHAAGSAAAGGGVLTPRHVAPGALPANPAHPARPARRARLVRRVKLARRAAAVRPPLLRAPGSNTVVMPVAQVTPPVPRPPGGPRPSAPPPVPHRAAAGYLTVDPGGLDLGQARQGQITISAQDGPVAWAATATSWQVELSSYGGTLQNGQSVTLTVTIDGWAGQPGGAWVDITQPGGASQAVRITWGYWARSWLGRVPPPAPSPYPAPNPSPLPSGSPYQPLRSPEHWPARVPAGSNLTVWRQR